MQIYKSLLFTLNTYPITNQLLGWCNHQAHVECCYSVRRKWGLNCTRMRDYECRRYRTHTESLSHTPYPRFSNMMPPNNRWKPIHYIANDYPASQSTIYKIIANRRRPRCAPAPPRKVSPTVYDDRYANAKMLHRRLPPVARLAYCARFVYGRVCLACRTNSTAHHTKIFTIVPDRATRAFVSNRIPNFPELFFYITVTTTWQCT